MTLWEVQKNTNYTCLDYVNQDPSLEPGLRVRSTGKESQNSNMEPPCGQDDGNQVQ